MPHPNSTTYSTGKSQISLRNKAVQAVLDAMGSQKGLTIFEIADRANVSLGYVRTVLKYVPEVQALKREGYVLLSAKGPLPNWAADVPNPQRATSTALVGAPDLPDTISHVELREEVGEKVLTFRRILRKTYLSPKSQRRELEVLTGLEVLGAEREEEHMRYIRQLEEQRASLEAFNRTLREHAELLKSLPPSSGRRTAAIPVDPATH
ncbi:MAG TPA: hypothetical protein VF559_04865 [Caulobacteraceae bacterium]